MIVRRTVISFLVVCGLLAPAGCSKDTEKGKETTTKAKASGKDDDEKASKKKQPKKHSDDEGDDDDGDEGASSITPFVKKHLAVTLEAAHCDDEDEAIAAWCLAAKGFEKAGKPKFPGGGTLVGVSTFVQTNATKATLENLTQLSALAFREDAPDLFAKLTSVKPGDEEETAETTRVAEVLLDRFAGKSKALRVNAPMGKYLDGLTAGATYPLKKRDHGYLVEGGSDADLRKVGKAWVAIEVPKKDPAGFWLSVFTADPYR